MLVTRCSECGRIYGTTDGEPLGDLSESHGVCPRCAESWTARLEAELEELEDLEIDIRDRSDDVH